jgi:hypothetical protein
MEKASSFLYLCFGNILTKNNNFDLKKKYSHHSPKNLGHFMLIFPHGNLVPFSPRRFLPNENSFLSREKP